MPTSPLDRLITLPDGVPELTLGWEAVKWAIKYLRQPNGPRLGEPFEPVKSQVRFWLWFYAVDENGDWLFHRAIRRLVKGSGKSPFAGAQALLEFTGPVRLKDFDPSVPGGCVGMPVAMPLVQVVATAEDQTANTMRMVRAFAGKKSRLVQDFNLNPGKEQYFIPPEGTLEQKTSSFTSAEGGEATFVVADETEHWTPAKGGPELANTLLDNLAKSGSRMLETCNAWIPGRQTVAESSFDSWVGQEEGRTRNDQRILYDARIAPPDTDLTDEKSLRKALEFVYDDCYWANRKAIMTRIWDTSSKPDDSKRKYLNWPSAANDAWTTHEAWALLAKPTVVVADKDPIALFFDGSKSRDATALIGCHMETGHVFTIGVWEPANRDDLVPVNEVNGAVAQAFERWEPVGFFADVREWESFAKVSWPKLYADRLLVHSVPAGKEPQSIAWDMRSHSYQFAEACETALGEIDVQAFTHDGDSQLTRHVLSARRHLIKDRVSISKESPNSPNKIDAAVCMVGARMVRRIVLASPEWAKRTQKKPGKVYGF